MRIALRILRPHSLTLTLTLSLSLTLTLTVSLSLSHLSLISLSLISPSSLSHLSLISLSSLSLSLLSVSRLSVSLLSLLSQEDPGKEPHIKHSSPEIVCPAKLVQGVLPPASPPCLPRPSLPPSFPPLSSQVRLRPVVALWHAVSVAYLAAALALQPLTTLPADFRQSALQVDLCDATATSP